MKKARKPKIYTIDVSKWRAGGSVGNPKNHNVIGEGVTALCNDEGYMCCLGQISLLQGYSRDDIFNIASPSGINDIRDNFLEGDILANKYTALNGDISIVNNDFSTEAMGINDDTSITTEERKKKLRELLKNMVINLDS